MRCQYWRRRLGLLLPGLLSAQWAVPEIPFDSVPNFLKLTDKTPLGEAVGVATNPKRKVYVYTRTGSRSYPRADRGRLRAAARGYLNSIKPESLSARSAITSYGFTFAHAVRMDPEDNIWVVDEGSNMIIKFNPQGRIVMTMGTEVGKHSHSGGDSGSGNEHRGTEWRYGRGAEVLALDAAAPMPTPLRRLR